MMNNLSVSRKKLAGILAFVLSISFLLSMVSFAQTSDEIRAQAQQKIERLQKEIDANRTKIANTEGDIEKVQAEINSRQAQLDAYKSEYDRLNEQVRDLDAKIAQLESEINNLENKIVELNQQMEKSQRTINATYNVLGGRMRAAYMAGEGSTLEVLLTATDFSDFLTRLELLSRTSKHDKALVKDLEKEVKELNVQKNALKESQNKINDDKKSVEENRATVATQRAEAEKIYRSYKEKSDLLQNQVNSLNNFVQSLDDANESKRRAQLKAQQAAEDYINNMANANKKYAESKNVNYKGNWRCPIRDSYYVSQEYKGRAHGGIDIAGCRGAAIYSAADGVVVEERFSSSWGNTVVVYHGNGIYTRYAHMAYINVSKGQEVNTNTVLGAVGNTGQVYGANGGYHLHLEVTVGGNSTSNRRNPREYIAI